MNAIKPTANRADWDRIITLYQELIHEHHWPFEPMLDLAQELSRSAPAQALCPSTSHEHLGFSLVRDYPQRVRLPQVWVHYQSRSHSFEITFRQTLGGPQEKIVCEPHEAAVVTERVLLSLLAWPPGGQEIEVS